VLYHIQSLGETISNQDKQEIAYEFQNAVTEVLIKKTSRAIEEFGVQTLIIGGGVAANKHIIKSFQEKLSSDFPETTPLAPARELTGDNALMIALAGYFKIQKNPDAVYNDIRAVGNLSL
jgi:N6-L-threonylcarbamoyladenine synthase